MIDKMEKYFKDTSLAYRIEHDGSQKEYKKYQKIKNLKIIKDFALHYEDLWKSWPGKHKNVMYWYLLEGGICIGHNENPAIGWSFPIIKIKDFSKYL